MMINKKIIKPCLQYKERKFVNLPKDSDIQKGDYLLIQKIKLEDDDPKICSHESTTPTLQNEQD